MERTSSRSTGWILAVVGVLFVATVLAPRAWRSVAIDPIEVPSGGAERSGALPAGALPAGAPPAAALSELALRTSASARIQRVSLQTPHAASASRVLKDSGALRDADSVLLQDPRPLVETLPERGMRIADLPTAVLDDLDARVGPSKRFHAAISGMPPEIADADRLHEIDLAGGEPAGGELAGGELAGGELVGGPVSVTAGRDVRSVELRRAETQEVPSPLLPAAMALPLGRRQAVDELRGRFWPVPESLLSRLEDLPESSPWPAQTISAIEQLVALQSLSGPQVADVLGSLDRLLAEADERAADAQGSAGRDLRAARHALGRRLDVWHAVHAVVSQPEPPVRRQEQLDRQIRERLAAVEEGLARLDPRTEWRRYLLVEEIRRSLSGAATISGAGAGADARQRCDLALKLLSRLESPLVTRAQRRFLQTVEIRNLADSVRHWTAQPIDYHDLLTLQEMVESGEGDLATESLARYHQLLRASSSEPLVELGQRLENHYRNANVRVVVSGRLLQQFLPADLTQRQRINDEVLGVPIVGRGTARTELQVELVPDPHRWRVDVSARGRVTSATRSTVGPATFFNRGFSRYELEKQVEFNQFGLRLAPAAGSADTWSRLARLETDLDWIPLLGTLVRSTAQSRYEDQLPATRRQLRRQVAAQAADRLDREFQRRLDESEARFRRRVLDPLARLELNPQAIDLQTTEDQLIGRFRVAAADQLAANRPRPKEPEDCLLAVQLHESTLNNGIGQLELEGKRRDLPALFRELSVALGRPDAEIPADLQAEDAIIEFADHDPLRVQFEEDRIAITLRLAELKAPGRRPWRELVVRAFYQPIIEDNAARLERDGYIQLDGARLRLRDQIALRGIFSKMFPRHPDINEISEALRSQPQLSGTRISQFISRDGWIAVALSEQSEQLAAERKATERISVDAASSR